MLFRSAALPLSPSSPRPLSDAIADLLSGRIPVPHPEAQVFKLLLVAACNYYHRLMPFLFEQIGDATELLVPEDLLTEHSIVADFRANLTDEDCQNEEVLGWFYQYYISERKDEVMARNAAVPKQDIPAVTQLFTPHWIVRYLVENSLGRLWLLNRPHSKLREKMPYYIDDSESGERDGETGRQGDELPGLKVSESQSPMVSDSPSHNVSQSECLNVADFIRVSRPEEIKLLDPACGSGHMLTYAFDLLYAIYEEEGYDAPEIPGLILRHNLYGVDICDRAVALAAFALCMKARAMDNRFFRRVVQPQLISLQEIRFEEGELSAYFKALGAQPSTFHPELAKLLYQFEEAKNFGSLIQPCLNESEILGVRKKLSALNAQLSTRDLTVALTHAKFLSVLQQTEFLCERYHVIITNPPYMGSKFHNRRLKDFLTKTFPNEQQDTYTCFISRCQQLVLHGGTYALITLPSWMALPTFSDFRISLFRDSTLVSLNDNGRGVWGPDYGSVAFVLVRSHLARYPTKFARLFTRRGEVNRNEEIEQSFTQKHWMEIPKEDLAQIPGMPLAYWTSPKIRQAFSTYPALSSIGDAKNGMTTGENQKFLRFWFEVPSSRLEFTREPGILPPNAQKPWVPYSKGGEFRKWFGNSELVLRWGRNGEHLQANRPKTIIRNPQYYFREAITWSLTSMLGFGARYRNPGFTFDVNGMSLFVETKIQAYVLAFLNSCLARDFLEILNPTIAFQAGDIGRLPLLADVAGVEANSRSCLASAKQDWDNFESSWDFRDLPLLRPDLKGATLAASWQNWKAECDAAIRRMQELETENNRLFIAAYGLQDELKPEVPEDQITLARADARKDMAAFLSYAVGCMMGRYSLDQPGLILADAGATFEIMRDEGGGMKELRVVKDGEPWKSFIIHPSSFIPDQDGILPVLDGEWFTDDIVARFREFLRVTFGEDTLAENLAFIEASLGKVDAKTGKTKPTDLRTYFVRDFYKNHISNERAFGYKKRPIYWMFSSPEGSFQALIYLHRYTRDTVNLLLNDYVREFIGKLEEKHRQLTAVTLNESARPGDRTKALKDLGKIDKMLKELRVWERDVLLPLAQQRIELDLDDGVKVNYLKFKGAVVNIPGLDKGEEE